MASDMNPEDEIDPTPGTAIAPNLAVGGFDDEEDETPPIDLADPERKFLKVTPEQRRAILGRLAEWEVMLSGLTTLQQNHIFAYLQDPTSRWKAALKAGYDGEAAAKRAAVDNFKSDRFMACLATGQLLREDRNMVTGDRTINELAIIAYSDISAYRVAPGTNDLEVKDGYSPDAMRAVSSCEFTSTVREDEKGNVTTTYKTKIKLWSKTDALRMLALHQQLMGRGSEESNGDTHLHQHNTWIIGGQKVQF